MLETGVFGRRLKELGYDFYSGVPCSFLKDLINYAINECNFVMAANEGDAVAICAGAYLGGHKSVFLCQNSGLTNAVSPLTSLNHPFRIPVLGFVSLRGEEGLGDEPQHELMGRITTALLDVMEIPWQFLSPDNDEAARQLLEADAHIAANRSFFFVVRKGTFAKVELQPQETKPARNELIRLRQSSDELPVRLAALEVITELRDQDTVLLAATGFTGRELYEAGDAPNNLYMVGSMGCVSSLGLGLALTRPDKKIIAIDGDGALLMRMGSMATNAAWGPGNMLHILLDNSAHESTGGQSTVSGNVDFVQVAASVGYTRAIYVHSLAELRQVLAEWHAQPRLTFLQLCIQQGHKENLGRPHIKPHAVKERLMHFLGGKA